MSSRTSRPPSADAADLRRLTVLNALQLGLIECPPDAGVPAIARTMAEQRVHCVVVTGIERRGERLDWGIVSDLDLMAGLQPGVSDATAGDLAASDVVVVEPGDSLEHTAQLMAEHQTAHVLVVSPDTGLPVGIVSTLDVARAAAAIE
jgi:CBS domain-containing protein